MNIHKYDYEMGEAINIRVSDRYNQLMLVKSMFNTGKTYNFYTHKYYP